MKETVLSRSADSANLERSTGDVKSRRPHGQSNGADTDMITSVSNQGFDAPAELDSPAEWL